MDSNSSTNVVPAERLEWLPGKAIPEAVQRHRADYDRTGLWPLVLGGPDDITRIVETIAICREEGQTPESALERALHLDVGDWLRWRREEDEGSEDEYDFVGNGQVKPAKSAGLVTHLRTGGSRPLPEVALGLFRVRESWHSLAKLLWAAFNFDMGPDIHCAMQRYWQKTYASEVVSATSDVIQCHVARPPRTPEAAMALAHEQYLYCPDIVSQGVGTITELACTLLNADYWYFWWD